MRISSYRPGNAWLERELDSRWRAWLTRCLGGGVATIVVLGGIVGPRQTSLRLRYEISRSKEQIAELEQEHRQLVLERERLTSPRALADELPELGLVSVPRERVWMLTPGGALVPAVPAEGPGR